MDNPERFLGVTIDGRYRLSEYIGSGSYGSVYAAEEVTLGRVISRVAVKLITPDSSDQRQTVLNEIVGLARLYHDYIIVYRSSGEVAYGELAGSIFLATELGDTTLARLLKTPDRIGSDALKELVRGVALALGHIHSLGAIHGDVKPANIIRVKGRWKLGDLGLMRSTRRRPSGPIHGSLTYLAPEMMHNEFGPASDVYALGVTMLYALTGKYAHTGDSREEFSENLRALPPAVPDDLAAPWKGLIAHCLQVDPARRLSAEQIEAYLRADAAGLPTPAAPAEAVLVVSTDGSGDYASIQQAINNAFPGTTVRVRPGKYREALRIDKPVELIADGSPEEVVVSTRDARCLELLSAGRVVVRGFTLRCRPGPAGQECYGVDVGGGRPVIEDCIIHSLALPCVAVHAGAEPVLRRCTILGSQDAGVFVFENGRGTFDSCAITGNGRSGVTIGEGGKGAFKQCEIADNQGSGVFVFAGGDGRFMDCEIRKNAKAGVAVGTDGRVKLVTCAIDANSGEAVLIKAGGAAIVTGCDLTGNAGGPWRILGDCELRCDNNTE